MRFMEEIRFAFADVVSQALNVAIRIQKSVIPSFRKLPQALKTVWWQSWDKGIGYYQV